MKKRKSYIGTLNGIKGVWVDKKPKEVEVEKEIVFYSPDEGKVLCSKEGELFESIIIDENTKISDFVEIVDPRIKKEEEKHEEPIREEPIKESSEEE